MSETVGHHPELNIPKTITQAWVGDFNARYAFGKYATTVAVEAWLEQSEGEIGDYTMPEKGGAEGSQTLSGNVYSAARTRTSACRKFAFTNVLALTNVHRHLPGGSTELLADGRVVLVRLDQLEEQLKLTPLRATLAKMPRSATGIEIFETHIRRYQHEDDLPTLEDGEKQIALAEVRRLDPELLAYSDETRRLVELGLRFGKSVTHRYGEPLYPRFASGTREIDVLMTYHNGGEDGHTSLGPQGIGVPRAVLIIAPAVNQAAIQAGRAEVFDPVLRAGAFYAAQAHDSHQLCGRALLPEGVGSSCGDERLSAEDAYHVYNANNHSYETARQIHLNVLATSFDPAAKRQNIIRTGLPRAAVLGQELTAIADLFHLTGRRGSLGVFEYACEYLFLGLGDRVAQRHIPARKLAKVTSMPMFLSLVESHAKVKSALAQTLKEMSQFVLGYRYPDAAIRAACGKGIDELFPGREHTATLIAAYANALENGATVQQIWGEARAYAGYNTQ